MKREKNILWAALLGGALLMTPVQAQQGDFSRQPQYQGSEANVPSGPNDLNAIRRGFAQRLQEGIASMPGQSSADQYPSTAPGATSNQGQYAPMTPSQAQTPLDSSAALGAAQPFRTFNLRPEFQSARQAILNGDNVQASSRIRQAAAMVYEAAQTAPATSRAELSAAWTNLNELAGRVDRGEVRDIDTLNQSFSQAHQAMAQYYYDRAQSNWHARSTMTGAGQMALTNADRETGAYLQAASDNVRDWAALSGRRLSAAGNATLDAAQAASGALIQGTGWTVEQVGGALDRFGSSLRNFGEWIEPGPGAAPRY